MEKVTKLLLGLEDYKGKTNFMTSLKKRIERYGGYSHHIIYVCVYENFLI